MMMKKLFPVLLFFFLILAKSQEADSLQNLINREKIPAKKSELFYRLACYWSSYDTVQAWQNLKAARTFSDKKGMLSGLDDFTKADIIFEKDAEKSQQLFKTAAQKFSLFNDKSAYEYQSRSWTNYGILEQIKGHNDNYLKILIEHSIPLAEKSGNRLLLAQDYENVGLVNFNQKLYDKAVLYYEKAFEILKKMPSSPDRNGKYSDLLNQLTEVYIYKKNPEKAAEYSALAKEMLQKNKALDNFTYYFLNSARIFELQDKNNEALKEIETGLQYAEKLPSGYEKTRLLNEKAAILKTLKRYPEAIAVVKALLQDPTFTGLAKNKIIYHSQLADLYSKKGDYKTAYEELRETKQISDSLQSLNMDKTVSEMETKYRTAEKEKEILKNEIDIRKKNSYLWLLGLLSLLLLSFIIIIYSYLKNQRRAAEQKRLQLQQQLREKEQQTKLDQTKALLEGEERERIRVAKDLHDGLGGMLAGVKIHLSGWASQYFPEQENLPLKKIISQLDGSVAELRRISRNMMPESLMDFGLATALKDLCEFYESEKTEVDFQAIGLAEGLSKPLQLNIFRIIQELLANAVKHADASHILVQCSQHGGRILITVEDDGKGMPDGDLFKTKSLGIRSLQNRVKYLNGKIEFSSAQNEGTSVNIELSTDAA